MDHLNACCWLFLCVEFAAMNTTHKQGQHGVLTRCTRFSSSSASLPLSDVVRRTLRADGEGRVYTA